MLVANTPLNPAERAAQEAIAKVYECLDANRSFRMEAGAGAGKTYSLVEALKHLIRERGRSLLRRDQKVACITYTNVARDEIESRIDGHPAAVVSTIHSFCWSLIKDFQPFLRDTLPSVGKWAERLRDAEVEDVSTRTVVYDLGYPSVSEDEVALGHDDVIKLASALIAHPKAQLVFTSRFPILLIDEYQDTNKDFASALKEHLLGLDGGPLIGLFGDHWQKIYADGCGPIEHESLESIGKGANFRSAPAIVDVLNRIRPELPQAVTDPEAQGSVSVFHTNDWQGDRQTRSPWKGDLPRDVAHDTLSSLLEHLGANGWDLSPERTKILMLTPQHPGARAGVCNLGQHLPLQRAVREEGERSYPFPRGRRRAPVRVLHGGALRHDVRYLGAPSNTLAQGQSPLDRTHGLLSNGKGFRDYWRCD